MPKLDLTGSNWLIFSIHFEDALAVRDHWEHFDGKTPKPTPAGTTPTTDEQKEIDAWDKEERIASYMLSQKLPDSAIMCIRKLTTVVEKWKAVKDEFSMKGLFAWMEMRSSFIASCCPPGAEVSHFLIDLGTRKEELISNSIEISHGEYHSTILNSIPEWLHCFASSVLASLYAKDPAYAMDPEVLSRIVREEYDRSMREREYQNQRDGCTYRDQCSEKQDNGNVALAAFPTSRPSALAHTLFVCWSCGNTGHVCSQCLTQLTKNFLKPFGAAAPASGTVNAAEPDDDKLDGIWAVTDVNDMLTRARDEVLGFYTAASLVERPVGGDTEDLLGLVELPDEEFDGKFAGMVTYLYDDKIVGLPLVETTELCEASVTEDKATLEGVWICWLDHCMIAVECSLSFGPMPSSVRLEGEVELDMSAEPDFDEAEPQMTNLPTPPILPAMPVAEQKTHAGDAEGYTVPGVLPTNSRLQGE